MTETPATPRPRRSLFRHMILVAVLIGLIVGIGALVLARVVQGERFRAQAEAFIETATGLNATLGPIQFRVLPRPRIMVRDIVLAFDESLLNIDTLQIETGLGPALRGTLDIQSFSVEGVVLRLPVERREIPRYVSAVADQFPRPAATRRSRPLNLDRAFIGPVEVIAEDGLLGVGEIVLRAGREGMLEIHLAARLPLLGADAAAEAALAFSPETLAVSGQLIFEKVDATQLDWVERLAPGFHLAGQATVGGTVAEGLHATLEGRSESLLVPALDGPYKAEAWWKDGRFILNGIDWSSKAGRGLADATYTVGEGWGVHILEIGGGPDLARQLIGFLGEADFALVPVAETTLQGAGLHIAAPNQGAASLVQGSIEAAGVDLHYQGRPLLQALGASVSVSDGVVHFHEIANDLGAFEGTMWIDYEARSLVAEASGALALERQWLQGLWPFLPLEEASGDLKIMNAELLWSAIDGFDLAALHLSPEEARLVVQPEGWESSAEILEGRGSLHYAQERLRLDPFEAKGVELKGHIDFEDGAFPFKLSGELDLASGLAALAMPSYLRDAGGRLLFTDATGSYVPGAGLASAFSAEGAIREGRARLAVGNSTTALTAINGEIGADESALRIDLKLVSERGGPLAFTGNYDTGSGAVEGALTAGPAALMAAFATTETQAWLAPLLSSDTVTMDLAFTQGNGGRRIRLSAPNGSNPGGTLSLRDEGDSWRISAFDLSATIPVAPLLAWAAPGLEGNGNGVFHGVLEESGALRMTVDLSPATVEAGALLRKTAARRLHWEGQGHWRTATPVLDEMTINLLDTRIRLLREGEGFQVPDLDLDLAALSPLLPEGASASGRLTGTVHTGGPTAKLRLEGVSLALSPAVSLSNLEGELRYDRGYWICDGMDIRGEGNDFRLVARMEGDAWTGSAMGAQMNLDGLIALRDAFQALRGNPEAAAGGFGASAFSLDLQEVTYHRGLVRNVKTEVHAIGDTVRLDPFQCNAYDGSVSGTVSWKSGGRAGAELLLNAVDLRALDDFLFVEPRGLSGAVDGTIAISFVPGAESHPLATLSGTIQYEARDGTYGRLGNATRLLALLKTTELIRLQLPTLRDDGLTFQSTSGHFLIDNGAATVESFQLRDRAYGFTGEGQVNFAEDTTYLELNVHILESVSGIVGSVPILRSTVDLFRETAGLHIEITGSPFAPEFEASRPVRPIRAIGNILSAPFRSGSSNDKNDRSDESEIFEEAP